MCKEKGIHYFDDNYIVFEDDPSGISEAIRIESQRIGENLKDMLERGIIPKSSMKYSADYAETLKKMCEMGMVLMSALSHSNPDIKPQKLVGFTAKSLGSFNGKMEFFYDALDYYKKNKTIF